MATSQAPEQNTEQNSAGKIALFYGSSTCYTEIAAEHIAAVLGAPSLPNGKSGGQSGGQPGIYQVELFNIATTPIAHAEHYRQIILGIPTWDYGELQEDWENIWTQIDAVNWAGKTVAIYGLGDQQGYPEWFQDALGYLWTKVDSLGATTIGLTSVEGYRFSASQALSADRQHFLGLALDEDSEFALSEQRIAAWCQQIAEEFKAALSN